MPVMVTFVVENEDAYLPGLNRRRRGAHYQSIALALVGCFGEGWDRRRIGQQGGGSKTIMLRLLTNDEIACGDVSFGGRAVPENAVSH